MKKWYFISKIVLTYCEKKNVLMIEKNFWNSRLKTITTFFLRSNRIQIGKNNWGLETNMNSSKMFYLLHSKNQNRAKFVCPQLFLKMAIKNSVGIQTLKNVCENCSKKKEKNLLLRFLFKVKRILLLCVSVTSRRQ